MSSFDSDPAAEPEELRVEARSPRAGAPPLVVFETMRAEGGRVLRLCAHLARLRRSAAYFGIPFDESGAREAIARELAPALEPTPALVGPQDGVQRLRLALEDGATTVAVRPFSETPVPTTPLVALARYPIVADHPRQRHKTYDRLRYDDATRWAEAHELADVLFLNERGNVAEGAISTVFVRRHGRLVTPPVADGALPGVLRAELLAEGEAVEGTLHEDDLRGELYLGSALRGLRRVSLAERRFAGTR